MYYKAFMVVIALLCMHEGIGSQLKPKHQKFLMESLKNGKAKICQETGSVTCLHPEKKGKSYTFDRIVVQWIQNNNQREKRAFFGVKSSTKK